MGLYMALTCCSSVFAWSKRRDVVVLCGLSICANSDLKGKMK